MSKVYIKKFHGKHFHIDYRESETIQIIFPKLNNKDRFIFEIEFNRVLSEIEVRLIIEDRYNDLQDIYDNLVRMSKKTSVLETIERINDV